MPRRKKIQDDDLDDFVVEDEHEEIETDSENDENEENLKKTINSHVPPLWQHHKPKTHGKRLNWRDWTKDAPKMKKSKNSQQPSSTSLDKRVIAQTNRLKEVKKSLVKATTIEFQQNLDEFIKSSCANKVICSITSNFNSSCNSSAYNSENNSEMGSEQNFTVNTTANLENPGYMAYNSNLPCAVIVGGAVNFTQITDIFKNSETTEQHIVINFEPASGKSQKNLLESLIEQAIPDLAERKQLGMSNASSLTFSKILKVLTQRFDGQKPLILNFFNIESFQGQVLSDFLDMLYSNQQYLPCCLIFHVATMLSSFTRILRSSILSKIKMEKINIPPARDFQEQLVDTLYFKQNHEILTPESDHIYLNYNSLLKIND